MSKLDSDTQEEKRKRFKFHISYDIPVLLFNV